MRYQILFAAALILPGIQSTAALAQVDTARTGNRTLVLRDSTPLRLGGTVSPQVATDKALEQYVFPPELVMQHAQRIGLKTEQRNTIRTAVTQLQVKVLELQWTLQDDAEKLVELLKRPTINEAETLAQIERVLATEREIKRGQMSMLIRIKNALTGEQQETLQMLRMGYTKVVPPF